VARSHAIVYRGYDPVELELIETQLRAAEVPYVRVGRGNAAMLGVGNYIVEQLLEVPVDRYDEARALIAAARGEDYGEDSDELVLEASGLPAGVVQPASARQQLVGAGLTLLFPGLGTAYVGYPLSGFAIASWSLAVVLLAPLGSAPAMSVLISQVFARAAELLVTQPRLLLAGRTRPPLWAQLLVAVAAVGSLQAVLHYAKAFEPHELPQQRAS
jgi:hypothetical protein